MIAPRVISAFVSKLRSALDRLELAEDPEPRWCATEWDGHACEHEPDHPGRCRCVCGALTGRGFIVDGQPVTPRRTWPPRGLRYIVTTYHRAHVHVPYSATPSPAPDSGEGWAQRSMWITPAPPPAGKIGYVYPELPTWRDDGYGKPGLDTATGGPRPKPRPLFVNNPAPIFRDAEDNPCPACEHDNQEHGWHLPGCHCAPQENSTDRR